MRAFEIVFKGELQPNADPALVRANLARLFQIDAARVEALFAGRRVLKTGLDEAAAEKYRAVMARAGARVEVAVIEPVVPMPQANAPSVESPSPSSGALRVAPRDEYMAAFADVQAPDFGLAEVGSDLQDSKPLPVAPKIDLSGLTLAPVGSDMGQAPAAAAPEAPDVSHLKVL
ncbi:hypothetical protein [Pseudomonas sp. Marseille-QA0892]